MRRVIAVILSLLSEPVGRLERKRKLPARTGFNLSTRQGTSANPPTFEIHTRIGRPYDVSFTKAILNGTGSNGC
jgi:hypothetical protein